MKQLLIWAKKFQKLMEKNQFILYLVLGFLTFYVFLFIQSHPTFLDPDSFYHIKLTKLIAEQGPIIKFPWLQFTVLKDYYVDHHFLYHFLAIPFVKFFGDVIGFKIYTVLLATLFVFGSYAFFKKYKLAYAEIFLLALLFAPALIFRISLAKASAFSLLILFAGIYCLFKNRYGLLFLLAWIYVWSYGGFLLLLVMASFYILAQTIYLTFIDQAFWHKIRQRFWPVKLREHVVHFFINLFSLENCKRFLAPLSGIIFGLIINPSFPQNIRFYWQQIFEIGVVNYRGAVNVGGEWYPYQLSKLLGDSGLAIILGAVCLVLFFVCWKKQKSASWFFFLTTVFFFVLTLKSQRYVEYFIPFLVYFSAFSFYYSTQAVDFARFFRELKKKSYILGTLSYFVLLYLACLLPGLLIKDAYIVYKQYGGGFKAEQFAGISRYLIANSAPGEIIMQTDWDDFPLLFYHNDKNYYIVGLDPTFMYNLDPQLYQLFADITMAKKQDNLYADVKNTFQASYFIVDADRAQLRQNLQKDGHFFKVYEDKDGTVYKVGP